MADTADAPVATIVDQIPSVGFAGDGTAGPGMRIMFRTTEGLNGTVWIAQSEYNPDNVRAKVRALALQMNSLHNAEV